MVSNAEAVFALLILNDIEAGASTEHLDALLRQLLAQHGYAVGMNREHQFVAVHVASGRAFSAYDSPLVAHAPTPQPENVVPLRPRPAPAPSDAARDAPRESE